MPERVINRLKRERNSKKQWYSSGIDPAYYLRDEDIVEFVNALKPVAFTAIFSKTHQSDARKAFQYLTFLRGDLMLPPFIEKVYESIDSLTEPHRYTSILGCLANVAREIATYNPNHSSQTQLHVYNLLIAVLPGIDPNDTNKTALTSSFMTNLLNCIVICDCTPALSIRNDLTEYEKELIYETSKFVDFVHQLFNKVFNYVETLSSSDISAESSASAAAAAAQTTINGHKNSEDLILIALLNIIRTLIKQSSNQIHRVKFGLSCILFSILK